MKKTTKPVEIKKVARVRDKATGDYFEVIEFPVSSTERSRLELPPSVVVDASAFERRLADKFGCMATVDAVLERMSRDCPWREDPRGACGIYLPDIPPKVPPDLPRFPLKMVRGGRS